MDDERAEIIERLCASAAGDAFSPSPSEVDFAVDEHRYAERFDRIDFFEARTIALPPHFDRNVIFFPDLYGEWVYRPC
jgi:hypothetical protein